MPSAASNNRSCMGRRSCCHGRCGRMPHRPDGKRTRWCAGSRVRCAGLRPALDPAHQRKHGAHLPTRNLREACFIGATRHSFSSRPVDIQPVTRSVVRMTANLLPKRTDACTPASAAQRQRRSRMQPASPSPSLYETLAGVNKFIATSRISPNFYRRHAHPIELACAFVKLIANTYPPLEPALRKSLPLSVSEGARGIEAAIHAVGFTAPQAQWFDAQSTEVLEALVSVVRDPDLPAWLTQSKWAVLGAFDGMP